MRSARPRQDVSVGVLLDLFTPMICRKWNVGTKVEMVYEGSLAKSVDLD